MIHSDLFHGTILSSGINIPRLTNNQSASFTGDTAYLPITSSSKITETFTANSSNGGYDNPDYTSYGIPVATQAAILSQAATLRQRNFILTGSADYREPFMVEAYQCGYMPAGINTLMTDVVGRGHATSDSNTWQACIDYLDRDDVTAIDALASNGFYSLEDISQSGASSSVTSTTLKLTPTLTSNATVRSATQFYWCNQGGATLRWMTDIQPYPVTNQVSTYGVWLGNETWGGGQPTSLTAATGPGILITVKQTAANNELILSAKNGAGTVVTVFDGYFTFDNNTTSTTTTPTIGAFPSGHLSGNSTGVPPGTYKTDLLTTGASTAGYLPGHPVEFRLDLSQASFQLILNGINISQVLSTDSGTGTALELTNGTASGTAGYTNNGHIIYGSWVQSFYPYVTQFWNQNQTNLADSATNTWPSSIPAIFTASTGAASGSGATPSPLLIYYLLGTDRYIGTDPYLNVNPSLSSANTALHEKPVAVYPNYPPAQLVNVVSRKTHGSAGTFDIDLPQGGTSVGVECRQSSTPGTHLLVATFDHPVTNPTVTVTSGTASVGTVSASGNTVSINLSGVSDNQTVSLSLGYSYNYSFKNSDNVSTTSSGSTTLPIKAGFLTGDFTGDGAITPADTQYISQLNGKTASATTFRADTSTSGTINFTVAQPSVNLASGTYSGPQTITLTDSTPGSTLYYTLDGSDPTSSATRISIISGSSITLSQTTTLKVATTYGSTNSLVFTGTYTILPVTNAPLLSNTALLLLALLVGAVTMRKLHQTRFRSE